MWTQGTDSGGSALDHPALLSRLFYPRREWAAAVPPGVKPLEIPVDENVAVGARFHPVAAAGPTILFFHGNGEIAADYDGVGPLFGNLGLNLLVVDYRGYGRSGGSPSVGSLLRDALAVFEWARKLLREEDRTGPLIVMGRSLGSAPALEIAARFGHPLVAGLVVESGFAHTLELLRTLGVSPEALGIREDRCVRNLDKIAGYRGPTLIIHGEEDALIPASEGRALHEASGSGDKQLLLIQGAGHNDLFSVGMERYLFAVADLARRGERPDWR